jgi:hypothetical protein
LLCFPGGRDESPPFPRENTVACGHSDKLSPPNRIF